jgi:hypothetical protein
VVVFTPGSFVGDPVSTSVVPSKLFILLGTPAQDIGYRQIKSHVPLASALGEQTVPASIKFMVLSVFNLIRLSFSHSSNSSYTLMVSVEEAQTNALSP